MTNVSSAEARKKIEALLKICDVSGLVLAVETCFQFLTEMLVNEI